MRVLVVLLIAGGLIRPHSHAHKTSLQVERVSNPQAVPTPQLGVIHETPDRLKESIDAKSNAAARWWKNPEWLQVVVNGFLACGTFMTLFLLKGQISATRHVERAFLIPLWQNDIWQHPEHVNQELKHCFLWRFKNEGNTPAFLRETYACLTIIDSLDLLPTAPVYPPSKLAKYKGDPLVSKSTMDRDLWVDLEGGEDSPFEETATAYRERGKILFAYGLARYEDMFGKTHETRFGLRYVPPTNGIFGEWVVDGPKSYNQYT